MAIESVFLDLQTEELNGQLLEAPIWLLTIGMFVFGKQIRTVWDGLKFKR